MSAKKPSQRRRAMKCLPSCADRLACAWKALHLERVIRKPSPSKSRTTVRPNLYAARTNRKRVYSAAVVAALVFPSRSWSQSPPDPRFDAIAALAEAKMKEFGVPGMALGILHNGTMTVRGLGITNVEDPLPVTAHTVFPIASISKTFAATAIMRLVEQRSEERRV